MLHETHNESEGCTATVFAISLALLGLCHGLCNLQELIAACSASAHDETDSSVGSGYIRSRVVPARLMLDRVASYVPFSNGLCSELSELISSFSLSEHASAFKRKARLACAVGATVMEIKLCDYRTNPHCLSMKNLSSKQKPYQRIYRPACLGYTKLVSSNESNPPFVGALPVNSEPYSLQPHGALSSTSRFSTTIYNPQSTSQQPHSDPSFPPTKF